MRSRKPGAPKKSRKKRMIFMGLLAVALIAFCFREESGPVILPGSTLVIEVEGSYIEAPQAPVLMRLLGEERRPFASLLLRFAMARRDDRLDRVVLVIRPLEIGWGKAGEIRAAIERLRSAGRQTVAYLDIASFGANREYWVASAADEIYLVPGGTAPVVGLAAEYFFLGGLWEKIGIGVEVGKAGRYKSAVESFAAEGMSEASREMADSLLDSASDAFLDGIAAGRGLTREEVEAIIDKGPMMGSELEGLGLIDGILHLDALLDDLPGEVVRERTYAGVLPKEVGFEEKARVALIYGSGNVVSTRGGDRGQSPVFAADATREALLDAADDPDIDAILLRIDSPGGSALAAEEMWQALERAKKKGKPIVASFSDVAASGGYYVAAAADAIVSTGGALTGSIGVFALRPVLGEALENIGINHVSLTRGRFAEFMLSSEPLSEDAHARLQDVVMETYRLFVERVAEGRGLSVEEVDAIAQGRVWTGRQAHELGLVDEIGGLYTAVAEIKQMLEDPRCHVGIFARAAPRFVAATRVVVALSAARCAGPGPAHDDRDPLRGLGRHRWHDVDRGGARCLGPSRRPRKTSCR